MALYRHGGSSKTPSLPTGITEFEILKARHKFLREDEEDGNEPTTWDDKLALKYYDSLYREFAVCDLKHYKSGNFSLRWRTEQEVLDGTGETTCANSRCEFHHASARSPALATLELPFAYEEQGEHKSALVKVVLCPACVKKLMWKRRKEKEKEEKERERRALGDTDPGGSDSRGEDHEESDVVPKGKMKRRRDLDSVDRTDDGKRSKRTRSRSRSRSRKHEDERRDRRRGKRKRDRSPTGRRGSDEEVNSHGNDLDQRRRKHRSSRSRSPCPEADSRSRQREE